MAITYFKKYKGTVLIHFNAAGTIIVAGNDSVSNIASPGEVIGGATIRRVVHGCNSAGHITISRASNLFGIYVNSGKVDYSDGMTPQLDVAANVVIAFSSAGAGAGFIELQKIVTANSSASASYN